MGSLEMFPLMPCMAASNCACSTPITTNTASSRSWCSMTMAGSSVPFFGRPSDRVGLIRPHLRRLVRAIRSNWPNTRILIRADGHYCSPPVIDWCRAPTMSTSSSGWRPPRRCARVADLETSTLVRFEASAKTNEVRRFKEFFDDAASWSRVERIAPASRSVPKVPTPPLHRHQSCRWQGQGALRVRLLPARRGREPHQVVEDASRRRPHILHQGDGQPVPSVPALPAPTG